MYTPQDVTDAIDTLLNRVFSFIEQVESGEIRTTTDKLQYHSEFLDLREAAEKLYQMANGGKPSAH